MIFICFCGIRTKLVIILQSKIYASGEDYLKTILVLQKKLGVVRSTDIAQYLNVTRPSGCQAMTALQKNGFVFRDKRHFLYLTEAGRDLAEKIYERHCFFTGWFISMGISREKAEFDACRIEHVISSETFEKIKEQVSGVEN